MAEETQDAQLQNSEETDCKVKSDEMQARIAQLEQSIASRDDELTAIKQLLSGAVAKYRAAVLASAAGIPQELVKGESLDEIDASLETARGIVSKVRQQIEVEAEANKVPAGAPPRMPQDLSALSPAEKIAYALRKS
jgi:DNA gyrase/topoisomerase IV subunit A